jgi:hypothetical protein
MTDKPDAPYDASMANAVVEQATANPGERRAVALGRDGYIPCPHCGQVIRVTTNA